MADEFTVYEYTDADPGVRLPIEPNTTRTTGDWGAAFTLQAGTRFVVVKANSASYVRMSSDGAEATSADYAVAANEAVLFPVVRNPGGASCQIYAITQ